MKYEKAIKIVRSVHEMSQQDFALYTGLSQSVVSRVESGERVPTEQFIQTLLTKFNIPRELFDFIANENHKTLKEEDRLRLATNLLKLLNRSSVYEKL